MTAMPVRPPNRSFEMHFSHLVGGSAEPPGLFLDMVGACATRGGYDYTQDAGSVFLRFMARGAGLAELAGRATPLAGGQLFVYWPGVPVRFHDRPGSPWDFVFCSLGGSDVPGALRRAGFATASRCYDLGSGAPAVQREARAVLARFRAGRVGTLYPVAAAWRLLLLASEAIGLAGQLPMASGLAQRARDLIQADEGRQPVARLAARLGVSRSTLFRSFHAAYAMPPKAYQELVSFERACHLLGATTLAVADIALRCGFADPDYFARRFRRRYHATPSAWRQVRQDLAADGRRPR